MGKQSPKKVPAPSSSKAPSRPSPRKRRPADARDSPQFRRDVRHIFKGKVFYFDVRSVNCVADVRIAKLTGHISDLGGTVEQFFSKEVTHVISDAPESQLVPPAQQTVVTSAETSACSPPCVDERRTPAGSVTAPARTRSKFFEALRSGHEASCSATTRDQSVSAPPGLDVLRLAYEWHLCVWSLGKFYAWMTAYLAKVDGMQMRAAHALPVNGTLRRHSSASGLLGPVTVKSLLVLKDYSQTNVGDENTPIAVQAICPFYRLTSPGTRPVFHVFGRRFPSLFLDGRPGTSPFYSAESNARAKEIQRADGTEQAVAAMAVGSGFYVPPLPNASKMKFLALGKVTDDDMTALLASATAAVAGINGSKFQSRKGFCEICHESYTDLDEHLQSPGHCQRTDVHALWADLDTSIALVNKDLHSSAL